MELECERIRREKVESQVDKLRQQLQQQTLNLEESQEKLQTVSMETINQGCSRPTFYQDKSPTENCGTLLSIKGLSKLTLS